MGIRGKISRRSMGAWGQVLKYHFFK
jgi:hypothetical protein